MKQYNVGILGATGMVGQRFITLLSGHPWFSIKSLAASPSSAGKVYKDAVGDRWSMSTEMPKEIADCKVLDATADKEKIAQDCDFVFSAVSLTKAETAKLEEEYAKLECPVVSNNSAHRKTADVPMVIPEINPEHLEVIHSQRKRLGTKKGFIAVKSNCSLQSYVPVLHPLHKEFGLKRALVCTYQAISGAGKNFERWPEMVDNIIPLIGGEEEKSEQEPLKIWGTLRSAESLQTADSGLSVIENAKDISITSQCIRVPVTDGHFAAVFCDFIKKPTEEEIISLWNNFTAKPQELKLPLAPEKFLHYFTEPDRPQIKLDRNIDKGMAVSIGRLRPDTQYQYKFVALSHNTLRGAAGGAVELAELLCAEGYI